MAGTSKFISGILPTPIPLAGTEMGEFRSFEFPVSRMELTIHTGWLLVKFGAQWTYIRPDKTVAREQNAPLLNYQQGLRKE